MSDQLNVSKSLKVDSTCRASNVYKRRGVYRKKYLNEVWALIDGTDYLVSFLDTSESREYINRSSRGHLINSLPVINLTEEELDELKKRTPHKPILRYKFHPSSSVTQSGSLYERYEMNRLAGFNNRGGNAETEIDNLVFPSSKKGKRDRYSLPRLYKLPRDNENDDINDKNEEEDQFGKDQIETDQFIEDNIIGRDFAITCVEEEEEENIESNDDVNNINDNNSDNTYNNDNASDNANANDNDNANDKDNANDNDNANDKDNANDNDNANHNDNIDKNDNINDNNSEDNANNNQDDDDDKYLDHDIHLNGQYPPGLGPNELGIDAFDLQQKALRENSLSSDDGDERPSNCGCGYDGSGEVVLQISLKNFIPAVNQDHNGNFNINTVPRSEWETIKAKGFDWVLFEDLPPTTDFKELTSVLRSCRLKSMMDYQSDEPLQYFDGVRVRDDDVASYRRRFPKLTIVSVHSYNYPLKKGENNSQANTADSKNNLNDQNALKYATYVYDNRPIECLRAKDAEGFVRFVRDETKESDRCQLLHYMCVQDLTFNPRSTRTAAAMLLTLPGMRVIDFSEIQLVDLVLIVLCKKAVRRGVFSFVNYKSTGNTFAWKYTRGKQHILIVANFDTRQTTTTIICDDCPMPIKSENNGKKNKKDNGKVPFVDILSQTTYLRDPEEMRTTGLNVILYEYEAQIFEY